jgi:hypothetical protein
MRSVFLRTWYAVLMWKWMVVSLTVAMPVWAQDACESRCNQLAAECLKQCTGESKEAAKPGQGAKLLACLKRCEVEALPCREACRKPAP